MYICDHCHREILVDDELSMPEGSMRIPFRVRIPAQQSAFSVVEMSALPLTDSVHYHVKTATLHLCTECHTELVLLGVEEHVIKVISDERVRKYHARINGINA